MNHLALKILFILILSFLSVGASAQLREEVKFKNFETSDFNASSLAAMCWDNNGFFWAISEKGLVKHNGYFKKLFPTDSLGKTGLLSNALTGMALVDTNEIWVSYRDKSAITRINLKTETFEHFDIPELMTDGELSALVVRVKKDQQEQYWLTTWGAGLIKFNPTSENQQYIFGDTIYNPNTGKFIKDMVIQEDGNFFVTFFHGPSKELGFPGYFNPQTGAFDFVDVNAATEHLPIGVAKAIRVASRIVHFVHLDEYGKYWLGTYSGLLLYDPDMNKVERVLLPEQDPSRQNLVNTLSYVRNGDELWIGTLNQGIMVVNVVNKRVKMFVSDPFNAHAIPSNQSKGLSKDKFGNIWVLNGSKYLSVYSPSVHSFKTMFWTDMNLDYSNSSAQNLPVNQVYVKNSNEIFVSSKTGLFVYDYNQLLLTKSYKFDYLSRDRKNRGVEGFKVIGDSILFNLDTYPYLMDLKTGKKIKHNKSYGMGNVMFKNDVNVTSFFYGMYNGRDGIRIFNYTNGFESHFDTIKGPVEIRPTQQFSFITYNKNWVISEYSKRLLIYDTKNDSFKMFRPSSNEYYFPDSTINCVYVEDSDDFLVGTSRGLYSFNEITSNFKDLTDSISSENTIKVNSIIKDDYGDYWMALGSELLRWNRDENKVTRFGSDQGVNSGDFLPAIAQKDEKGNLYFVSMNGIVVFNPKELLPREDVFELKVQHIIVNGDTIKSDYLDEFYNGAKQLQYDQNFIEFDLYTNQVFQLAPHQFSYTLEGLQDDWVNNGASNKIRFDNLQAGIYKLRISAKNAFGYQSDELVLSFQINPPFWKRWWFLILMIVAIGGLIYLIVKGRMSALKKRSHQLELTVQERTAEVLEQKQEAEKQREEAEHQKKIVEEKQQEITDSITYAKRIQHAILPSDELIKEHLTDSFVLYIPKDIVAGDFYWLEKLSQDEVMFAVADCTGHGVPGAMVSVVCNNAMNRSVREFEITEPGQVLDKTKELILEQFEKNSGEEVIKDGMDIALCKLNTVKNHIQFSGANNPFLIVRNGEFIELKGDKQPVGEFEPSQSFTTHELELEKGDMCFMYSDGFADQFGGEKGKKFKSSSLKKLLAVIADKSSDEQQKELFKVFNSWKGDYEQLDDVCIIGFRI